jgi:hypothetical protein
MRQKWSAAATERMQGHACASGTVFKRHTYVSLMQGYACHATSGHKYTEEGMLSHLQAC